ncbi:pyridoxine 5'-phosphate synthase [Candidatus Palauibacter soopunensis]|uniref:pyridoxine 5'-phosphate synthase n=1 Tax=Candidatus Palauibacter soopunensis TaxID=3056739 RepID=UPI002398EFBF|nr:pyridoxine 5'-phosphate synthase [Candidatus Palauibacter soopunensis]MDE2878820.1 pyridoxine 5'-phosphate synthase [Candidatus Palauibacter soopunensis]
MANSSFSHLVDCRLCVNIDHVATVRQARGTDEPDPVRAAVLAELGGANGITVHLREDRRHIQDRDVELLLQTVRTFVNLELAAEEEVLALAERWRPAQATLVPEKREELTTEGGLDLSADPARIAAAVARLQDAGIRTSLFIDPDPAAVDASAESGAAAIELHTGEYANAPDQTGADRELSRLEDAAARAEAAGLGVHAGHGLTYENVQPVAAIPECEELNIGHSIVSRSVLVGIERAVLEMSELVREARG